MKILISTGGGDPANYVQAVRKAGGEAVAAYLPPLEPRYDGLILAGGGDMEPALFGQLCRGTRQVDLARDRRELALLDVFVEAGIPVLGICRGHQVVNVWAGGDLIQDLGPALGPFHQREEGDLVHLICTAPGSRLGSWYGGLFPVNSNHHQGVGRLGQGLRATAWSEGGVVEGMEHERLPLWTVQFHPERMEAGGGTVDGGVIFRRFLALCGGGSG